MITSKDLIHNKYNLNILVENVKHLDKKYLLYTQVLTAEFCADYIYEYDDSGSEDSYLFDMDHILKHQSHIDENTLSFYIKIKKQSRVWI